MLHARPARIAVAAAGIGFGILLSFIGFNIMGVWSEPGGCRMVPFWPLVAPGLGLIVLGAIVITSSLRTDTKPK